MRTYNNLDFEVKNKEEKFWKFQIMRRPMKRGKKNDGLRHEKKKIGMTTKVHVFIRVK